MNKFKAELKEELEAIDQEFKMGLLTAQERFKKDFEAKNWYKRIQKMIK